jgi:hypothetical protein
VTVARAIEHSGCPGIDPRPVEQAIWYRACHARSNQNLLSRASHYLQPVTMITNPGQIIIFGLPVYFYLGILTFIALISTATLGMLYVKGKYGVQFSWHMNLAKITIIIAIIHAILVVWGYLF